MTRRTLLLNRSMEPITVISDREAVVMYLDGDIDAIEYSGEVMRSPSTTVLVPSVAVLRKYVHLPHRNRSLVLTTRNVCARDNHECGYCGKRADTIDHVVPRALGGPNTWENVTAACGKCNRRKSNKTLTQLGWKLERTPHRPAGVDAHLIAIRPYPEWLPYLG